MSSTNDDPIAAGYVLALPVTREGTMAYDLLPPTFPTISECLTDFAPGTWCLAWATRDPELERAHREFGLVPHRAEEPCQFCRFSTESFDRIWGWPHVIFEQWQAQEIATRFLDLSVGVRLLGIGLPRGLVPEFLDYATPDPPRPGFAQQGETGFVTRLRLDQPLATGGVPLGWEVLGFDVSSFHSWVCNGLESQVASALGIRPNGNGLITDVEDARVAAAFCGGPEARACPALWMPWFVSEYPLEHRSGGAV
jgi:hypothetical protein